MVEWQVGVANGYRRRGSRDPITGKVIIAVLVLLDLGTWIESSIARVALAAKSTALDDCSHGENHFCHRSTEITRVDAEWADRLRRFAPISVRHCQCYGFAPRRSDFLN